MNALQEQFVIETRELIQQAIDDVIALEAGGFAAERIERVFRAFHTLKGSAGVVGLPAMGVALHAAEDLLSAIQTGRVELDANIIDCALACLDQVSQWVDEFETRGELTPKAVEAAIATKEKLRRLLPGGENPATVQAAVNAPFPPWALRLIESAKRAPLQDGLRTNCIAVSYQPRPDCFFNGDDPLRTLRRVSELLVLHIEPVKPWPPLAEFDPYTCNLHFECLVGEASREELSALFRLMPDQVRMVDIPLSALRPDTGRAGQDDGAAVVRAIIEEQARMLRLPCSEAEFRGRITSAAQIAANVLRFCAHPEYTGELDRARAAALGQSDAAPLLAELDRLPSLLTAQTPPSEGAASLNPDREHSASRNLRVDESKIDALGNLAGEFLVLKNAISHLAKRAESEAATHDFALAIRQESDAIERLSSELNQAILQLRMVPVTQIFRPFPRIVRDLAQKLDKKIALTTAGETTEADKTIVDRLFEPVLHLVRNAIDHGIEDPDARRAAGKPELATITLRASSAARRFIVEVTDDGRGIDPGAIRRKAAERNLLPADQLDALSDEQAIELIFAGGFSTAAEITDISGRGVGMDVVRTAIGAMDGRTSIISRVGEGTTVKLELPITIAMSRVMVVEAAGHLFGIPMDAVSESIRVGAERITQIKTNEGFTWRGRVVPICTLVEMMKLPVPPQASTGPRLFAIVESGPRVTALEIDAIKDRLEVVLKPMQGMLSGARGYAGTTLLGDGRVLLVLDPKELLP